jgi:RNA polymerase sigma-70 factor (ECF subfamily)
MFALSLHWMGRPVAHERAGRPAICATLAAPMPLAAAADADDDALLREVARGDARAYRVLTERYLAKVVRYAERMLGRADEAEDVAQETFLRLWQHASRYDARGHKPSTWLYRVAHNLCVDRLRQRRPVSGDALDERASPDRTSAPLADRELSRAVQAAVAELPERQRAALVLVHDQELTQVEAAEVLGCGVDALESLLARARRSLRERLAEWQAAEGKGQST